MSDDRTVYPSGMTDATKPHLRPEAMEGFRYRRRLLTNRRTYLYRIAAEQIRAKGNPRGSTKRRLKNVERAIREYNSFAEEYGLQPIR